MHIQHSHGKATLLTILSIVGVFLLASFFDIEYRGQVASVQATSTATTTVTVLNTPPAWTLTARELYASATTSPTNVGTSTVWTAIATDNNGEDYYFLVCKSSSTPTHPLMPGNPLPQCGGGAADQWGISAVTNSGVAATVSTTTQSAWSEKNSWYGYICDANTGDPECNTIMYNGLHESGAASATSSPFVVNHAASFTVASDDSPALPGVVVNWTTTATDTTDVIRGGDNLKLFVCRANDFDPLVPACGVGGTWATSTFTTAGNPSASVTIPVPTQDGNREARVFIIDEFGLVATGAAQGSNTLLQISNATPYVSGSTVELYDVFGSTTLDYSLALTEPEGQTQNFVLRFDVVDDNGCQNTSAGNEITGVDINVYRSQAADPDATFCDASGEYDANFCYTDQSPNFVPTCYQDPAAACLATTPSVTWECVFPLWYVADPTDVGSVNAAEDWRASARATDDGLEGVGPATGSYATSTAPANTTEMTQFLSFRATGSPIAYGSWEPGQGTSNHPATTTVYATGNTGLNQYLSGDPMCTAILGCTYNGTSTIWVPAQHYSLLNSTLYAAGTPLSTSTTPVFVDIVLPKTTSTSSPASDDTFWSILVPSEITYAGDYIGTNYIDAVVAPSGEW